MYPSPVAMLSPSSTQVTDIIVATRFANSLESDLATYSSFNNILSSSQFRLVHSPIFYPSNFFHVW